MNRSQCHTRRRCAFRCLGGDIIMGQADALEFATLSEGTVVANHLEAINHCPVARQELRQAAIEVGIAHRLLIPADGQYLEAGYPGEGDTSGRRLSYLGRYGSRLCENALNTSKTESREGRLWNKRAEGRVSLVSDIDIRNALWAASAAQRATHGRANGAIYALIASISPAIPKIFIMRLRL